MPSFIPSKRFAKKYQGSGGGGSPPPESTTNGVLDKTPYGYLSRDLGAGINYTQNFSVVVALDIPFGGFTGYYGEVFRHGRDASSYNATRPGWTLNFTNGNGYGLCGVTTPEFIFSDGSGQQVIKYPGSLTGRQHMVFTFNATSKTLRCFVNGVEVGTGAVNASMSLPTSINYPMVIGGHHNSTCGTVPSGETVFVTNKFGLPEFKMYLAQVWQKELSPTEAADLYTYWNGQGRTDIPGTVTGTPVTSYNFKDEVGDAAGTAGSGWLKDMSGGGNHLKIVNINTYTGTSGTIPNLVIPSGSVRISNISNGATGVSGGVTLRADGLSGTGNYQQYYIEVDEANTFSSPELKQSGWLLADGQYKPLLKPSTVYYIRVKGRNGDTLTEGSWSSTISFTTRAVTEWFVRPLSPSTTKVYGNEDGSSYANAWNGFRWQGHQGGRQLMGLQGEADARKVAPGDTIWHCGYFGPINQSDTSSAPPGNQPWYQYVVGNGIANYPIKIRFDHGTYPGGMFNLRKPTSSWGWVDQGGGVWSTTQVVDATVSLILFDEDNSGLPTMGTPVQDKTYLKQGAGPLTNPGWYVSGGTTYVKRPDGANPGNTVYYMSYGYVTFGPLGQHIQIQGGSFYNMQISHNYSTDITVTGAKLKYFTQNDFLIHPRKYVDRWIVEDCDISWARGGVYSTNEGTDNAGNDWTVRRNWIHHIGPYTNTHPFWDDDAHAIGIQGSNNWIVEDNLCEYCGSTIEQFSNNVGASNLIVRRNVIRKPHAGITNGFASGITFSGGTHTVGNRPGFQVLHNVVINTDGSSFHDSNADLHEVKYNLFINAGQNPSNSAYTRCWSGNAPESGGDVRAQNINFQYNVCINPAGRYISGGGNGTGTITINNNLYWDNDTNATTADKLRFVGIGGGSGYSFNAWKALGGPDQNSFFEDPYTTSHLPTGFDPLMRDTFHRNVICDVDGDGDVDSNDLAVFDAYAAGSGARVAARKLITNIIAYGNY
jgi:hypothetical protein